MKLYTLVYLTTDMSLEDVFRQTEIFTENGLKKAFASMVEDEQFNTSTIDCFDLSILSEKELENVSVDFILRVLKYDGYTFTTINIENIEGA